MKKTLLSFGFALLTCTTFAQAKVYYVELASDTKITANPIKEFAQTAVEVGKESSKESKIYPKIQFQTMAGIGGCFNEIGGVALMTLPEKEREEVMANLFGKDGAQLSFCRTAIGSSDFGVNAYSYSEVADDYNMAKFSIEREKKSVIPYIQLAVKNNPQMQLFGSPWSPPAWMKESGLIDQGNRQGRKNRLKDDPKVQAAYAKYFAKYVQAYAKEGITVNRILIQNESDISTKYPSCVMLPSEMHNLISKYVRPEFEKNKIKTEIWAGTFRAARTKALHALEFASNPGYLDVVDGIGIQYTHSRLITDLTSIMNGKPLMHTECICYNGKNNITQGKSRFEEVASYVNFGSENFAYWNMILDETTKSGWGWAQNSLVNINRETKEVTYNPDYAAMSLISRFIQPGAVRIANFNEYPFNTSMISMKQGDKIHLIVQNSTNKVQKYTVKTDGSKNLEAYVPANSIAAIVY